MLLLGDSSTVELRTLTPSILVRIQVPQPNFYPSQIFTQAKFMPSQIWFFDKIQTPIHQRPVSR